MGVKKMISEFKKVKQEMVKNAHVFLDEIVNEIKLIPYVEELEGTVEYDLGGCYFYCQEGKKAVNISLVILQLK